ncbi:nonsense-mediated mrna decay protein [Salix suchowensis]|nr:nonsense-mediated mrna decay protein [Salix suchowensis]
MDLQTLSNLFATTFSPDPNVRKAGNWTFGRPRTHRTFRSTIAQGCHISSALAVPSHGITAQLSNTLKTLVINDYPDNWPGLLAEVKRLLASSEVREVHAGCVASLEIVRAFRSSTPVKFRQKSDILSGIVVELMPSLVQIATQMLQSVSSASSNINPSSQEIPTMLHLILKTYKTSIIVNLSTHQQSADSLVPWGQLLFAVINFEVPQVAVPADEEERERCEWWKVKKWAYGILFRLFHRFGNPSQLPSTMKKEYKTFADHFVTMFAPEISISIFGKSSFSSLDALGFQRNANTKSSNSLPNDNLDGSRVHRQACEIIGTLTKSGLEWSNDAYFIMLTDGYVLVELRRPLPCCANALDDAEFPVRVQAALALTQLVVAHESVRTAVAPQVGKVIQDLLKLSDDTDLDILNRSMEVMVEQFQTELLPVAAQLTARLNASQEETGTQHVDLESLPEVDEDKTFAAMGVSKTISTVRLSNACLTYPTTNFECLTGHLLH